MNTPEQQNNMTTAQQLNVKEFPFTIKDPNGNQIYWESSDGFWSKREYDTNGKLIYYEKSNGFWVKSEYDSNGKEIYWENSDREIIDNRPKPEPCANYIEDTAICDSYGEPKGQCANCGGKDHEHPDHFAETSKKIDDACEIAYHAHLENGNGFRWSRLDCYRAAWQDALAWKGGGDQASGIEAMVCDDIAKRQQVGIAKYGTTVAENPLTHAQWLQHAYEECLDMAVYLKRATAEKGGEEL
jgi:hypothetical protein